MPQPAGQYVGAPLVQGEAKLKRSPLILGFVGWVFVACSFLLPYLLIRDAIKSGHPEGAGWVWILFLIMWIGLVAPVNIFRRGFGHAECCSPCVGETAQAQHVGNRFECEPLGAWDSWVCGSVVLRVRRVVER